MIITILWCAKHCKLQTLQLNSLLSAYQVVIVSTTTTH